MRSNLTCAILLLLGSKANVVAAEVLDVGVRASLWDRAERGAEMSALLHVSVGWEALLFGRPRVPVSAEAYASPLPLPTSPDVDPSDAHAPDVRPSETRPSGARSGAAAPDGSVKLSEPTSEPPDAGHSSERPSPDSEPDDATSDKPHVRDVQRETALSPRPVWLKPAFAAAMVRVVMSRSGDGETRTDSLSGRSRLSAVLPVLRLRAGRGIDESMRYSPTTADPDRWLMAGGADLSYEAQATWTLDRLVFADDEVSLERLRQQARRARGQRALQALKLLFRWQAARVKLSDPEREPDLGLQLSMIQAEIELDVLTGGWFSKQVASFADP